MWQTRASSRVRARVSLLAQDQTSVIGFHISRYPPDISALSRGASRIPLIPGPYKDGGEGFIAWQNYFHNSMFQYAFDQYGYLLVSLK